MTTGKKKISINGEPDTEEAKGPSGKGSPAAAAAGGSDTPATGADAAPQDVQALLKERDELAEALLRLRAEFDNYRKRSAKELIDARSCAQGDLLADLFPVLDNLERALDAAEHHEEGKVLQGVRMTRDLFVGLLERAGVEEIPGAGTPFDPLVHDAVVHQASEEEEGIVTAVLERGYRQGDQVLRPARVVVSAGDCDKPAAE